MAGSNISLTYNGVTIGGDQFALQLHDYQIEFAYDTFRVETVVSLHSDTAGNLKTLRDSTVLALTAFSKDFSIQRGATVIWSVDESEKTQGYLARPTFDLLNTPDDHELRQTFRWACTFMRGATSTEDEGGRLAAQISVTTDAMNYNTITVTGTYTAVPAAGMTPKRDAREAYLANAGAFVTGILTLIGGAQYKVVADNYQFDDESARLIFTATRRQVKVPENAAGTFEAGIREQSISLNLIDQSSLGIPRSRVSLFQAAYTATLDTAVVAHTGQQAFYENTILPHVVLLLRSLVAGDTVAIENHAKTFRYDGSSISVSLQGFNTFGDGDLISHERNVSYHVSTQKEFRERWDGRQHSRVTATPGPVIEAEVVVEERVVGDPRIRGIENVSSGPASSPGPFDLGRDANYMRPGIPPFPADLVLANRRPPGSRISVGGAGGANAQGASSDKAGGAPPKPQPARPLDDPSFDDDPFTPGFQRPFTATTYDDDPFTEGIQPPIGEIATVARAGGRPPVPGGAAEGGSAEGELIWILMDAYCEASGKFVGYNDEPGQENFSKVKTSMARYVTRWVWGIESSAPVATILVQPGTPSIAPDSPAERGTPG